MNKDIRPVSVHEAAREICGKRAMILCHVNPDGDALGSAAALAELLKLTGGDGRVVTPSPVPKRLSFILGDADTSYTAGAEAEYELLLSVDTASPSQLGELEHLAKRVVLSFDHHESCTPYSPHVLYSGAAAAGLVILSLLEELEAMHAVSGDVSGVLRRLFAAISSDTGSFKYANASPEAFAAAAMICDRLKDAPLGGSAPIDGMTTSDISAALFDCVTKKDILVRQLTYRGLRYICGGRIAVSAVSAAEMAEAGLRIDDFGGMVDCVRSIEGTVAGIALREAADSVWRGSSRANCDFDVSAPASKLLGGGHRRAAGFRLTAESADEAVRITERVFGEALEAEVGNE